MINIPQIKRKPMQAIHLRLPVEIREAAKAMAEAQSTEEVTIKEADVYRGIIEFFFAGADTKCLQSCKHNGSN